MNGNPFEDQLARKEWGSGTMLHGINPERILIAAGLIGLRRAALFKATDYAKERIVFEGRSE